MPYFRLESSQNSILYKAIKIWNKLPANIRITSTAKAFQKKLRLSLSSIRELGLANEVDSAFVHGLF
jgi:hypothetical protein